MDRRVELHTYLKTLLPNVYFQPPSNVSIAYPCVIYTRSGMESSRANNKRYIGKTSYSLILVFPKMNNDYFKVVDSILESLDYCEYENEFVSDNLYHINLKLYY